MRYLKTFSFLVAFFLGGLLFSFTCKAAPVPTTQTFTVLENTVEQLFNFGFVPQSLMPYGDISTTTWDPWQTGGVLLNFDLNDCEITELTSDQKSELLSNWTIVNDSNINITTTDSIYSVKMDNGYFTGYVYVDDQGKILSYTNDLGGQLLQVKFGGSIKSTEDWEELYASTATKIYDANMTFYYENPDTIPNSANTFYCFQGVNQGGTNPIKAQEIFIPNQYQKGVVVPNNTTSGSIISSWFANNITDAVIINTVFSNSDNPAYNIFNVTRGTFSKDNVTYNYFIERMSWIDIVTPNNTYQAWRNYNNTHNVVFAIQSTSYNPSLLSTNKSVSFKPLQVPEGSEVLNYDYYYDYEAIQRLETALNNLTQQLNSQFNNQNQVSENNFPYYYPTGNTEATPSEIPFPDVINYPNFTPLPVPNNDPNLDYSTLTQPTEEEVELSFDNFNIPFVNGLFNRYPFCIPWDIKDFINSLKATPQAPAWNFDYSITVAGQTYTTHFEGDLSDYNSLATIFRNLLLIGFIIGLCKFSYDHHF